MGAQNQHYYVVKEDGKYRLAGVDKGIGEMGRRIDQLADVHDLETARKILDWLRGDIKANSGDDPLSGEIFTRFWKRGQEGDEAAIRRAAWSLVSNTKWAGFYRPQITAARNAATGAERTDQARQPAEQGGGERAQREERHEDDVHGHERGDENARHGCQRARHARRL